MTIPLILALLISGPMVEVAIKNPGGAERHASFPNTKEGVASFGHWLSLNAEVTDATTVHSCVATPVLADDAFFSSPFFEFAYDNTENTFVWSRERLNSAVGGDHSATAMLKACALEHRGAA